MNNNANRKSFTLIELLVVLALVAILSVVVIITLNPAELIKQARDSNRLSDLATINTSLNLFSSDVTGGFMGTSSIVYVSIPDNASSTCGSLGLPTLPTGWVYNCVTSQNLRNTDGSGWIPVNFQRISSNSPISQLPIDLINTTTSLNYYTYITGGSWKLSAFLEAQKNQSTANLDGGTAPAAFELGNNLTLGQTIFPNGWIKVPGNSTFGTSNFWVMKYEAKCSDISGNLLTSPDTGNRTYANNAAPCLASNSKYITSTAGGYPVVNIALSVVGANNDAGEYCQSIGAHLITNNEWQTIAWNAENVASNWSGGAVGSGYIYSGHNDSVPGYSLLASIDDSNGYFGETNTGGTQRRTLTLSNGSAVWDFAGNAWEWTNDTITGANQPTGGTTGFTWREFTAITTWGTMTQQTAGPSNSAWNSTQGIGQIYSSGAPTDSNIYGSIRSGNWGNSAGSGVETLNFIYFPTNSDGTLGFRCAR